MKILFSVNCLLNFFVRNWLMFIYQNSFTFLCQKLTFFYLSETDIISFVRNWLIFCCHKLYTAGSHLFQVCLGKHGLACQHTYFKESYRKKTQEKPTSLSPERISNSFMSILPSRRSMYRSLIRHPIRARWEFTHFWNVFFCTDSLSSTSNKNTKILSLTLTIGIRWPSFRSIGQESDCKALISNGCLSKHNTSLHPIPQACIQ